MVWFRKNPFPVSEFQVIIMFFLPLLLLHRMDEIHQVQRNTDTPLKTLTIFITSIVNSSRASDNEHNSKRPLYKGHTRSLSIILIHFNLQLEDNLSIKDKMARSKCVHYSEIPQNTGNRDDHHYNYYVHILDTPIHSFTRSMGTLLNS